MNKISLYILLILIFLGLSKSFSPSEHQTPYLANERVFPHFFGGAPITVILVDSIESGLLIKTYFQRLKIVHGFSQPEYITIRTSQSFWRKNLENIGMSLFRRKEIDGLGDTTPAPPGSLFLGDPSYGTWAFEASGNQIWQFHRAYRNFPQLLNWQSFTPTYEFYEQLQIHLQNNQSYYGPNKEFGKDGKVTSQVFSNTRDSYRAEMNISFLEYIRKKLTLPPWRINPIK